MNTENLTSHQRQIRQNIRNGFLVEDVSLMEQVKERTEDEFSQQCLQEMIDECKKAGVDNYGKLPL